MYKWKNLKCIVALTGCALSTKITSKTSHVTVHQVRKQPRVTSNQPKASFTLANIEENSEHGVHGRAKRIKSLLSREREWLMENKVNVLKW